MKAQPTYSGNFDDMEHTELKAMAVITKHKICGVKNVFWVHLLPWHYTVVLLDIRF